MGHKTTSDIITAPILMKRSSDIYFRCNKMSDLPSHSQHPAPARPQLLSPPWHWLKHCRRCFSVSTQSANSMLMTRGAFSYGHANQYVMIVYHMDRNLFYNRHSRQKQTNTTFQPSTPSWQGWLLAGFWWISISEIMRPVQTSNESPQNHGRPSSNWCCWTCTREIKPSG